MEVRGGRAAGVRLADGSTVTAGRAVLADTAVETLARDLVGEEHLPADWLAALGRHRHGLTGYFRLDVDLRGDTPWLDPALGRVGVVHLLGSLAGVRLAMAQASSGELPDAPALVAGQQDVADPSRVVDGVRTLWVEGHAPTTGWTPARTALMQERVLARLEAHAPGLAARTVAVRATSPGDLQARDPNLVGGDVGGGSQAPDQQLVFRPAPGWPVHATPVRGLWLCSASAHPGGGAHGIVGWNAAHAVLRRAGLERVVRRGVRR